MGDLSPPQPHSSSSSPHSDHPLVNPRRREPSEPRSESDWDGYSREGSPDMASAAGELVRRAARRWSGPDEDPAAQISRAADAGWWLGEIERERVRLVREWVQMAARDHDEAPPPAEHARLRIRGRQARLELVTRLAADRNEELQRLSLHRSVSDFPHRTRIQALLRVRFLRNGGLPEEERRLPSVAARELGQLRQQHPVSALREGFRFGLENLVRGQAASQSNASSAQNVELSTNDHSEASRTVSEDTRDRHQLANGNVDIQRSEGMATTSEYGSNTPSIAESSEPQSQADSWHEGLEQERRDWEQISHVITGEGSERNGHASTYNSSSEEGTEVRVYQDPYLPHAHDESTSDNHLPEVHEEQYDSNHLPEVLEVERVHGNNHLEESYAEWNEDNDPTEVHDDWQSDDHPPEVNEEWHDDDESNDTTDNWHDVNSGQRMDHDSPRIVRSSGPFDVVETELRELISRQNVSNLLHSDFRENLDRFVLSYVERQSRGPDSWDQEATPPAPDSPEQGQEQRRDDEEQELHETVVRPRLPIPHPPPIPPGLPLWRSQLQQPSLWRSQLQRDNWIRQNAHRSDIEREGFTDLKADMARLQQGMSHMQRMLEACMDMQLELQRSVRQEVSAALNRFIGERGESKETIDDGSKWVHVRKGTCCVCCDTPIDSVLYRCGHMCACSKCAHELVRSGGKCPLCRAPIIEVIRAYFIM